MGAATPGSSAPVPILPRPRLASLHHQILVRPLTTVVAGAGYGKSTLVRAWEEEGRVAVLTLGDIHRSVGVLAREIVDALRVRVPGLSREMPAASGPEAEEVAARATAVASFLAESVRRRLTRPLALVLDDLHELDGSESVHAVEALVRQAPPDLRLVLAGRRPPPFPIARLRGRGGVLEIDAGHLSFTPDEVAELTGQVTGESSDELAATVLRVTGGWPVAVRLALEAVRDQPPERRLPVLERAGRPGSPLFDYLVEEVFGAEDECDRRLLAALEPFDAVPARLLGCLGFQGAEEALIRLSRKGVYLEIHDDGWAPTPLVRTFLAEHAPLPPDERRRLLEGAVGWFEDERRWREALACAVSLAEPDRIERLLGRAGHEVLAAGHARAIIAAVEALPELRSLDVRRLRGEARQVLGDWDGALADFEAVTPPEGRIEAGLAWRLGLIHHMRGDLAAAVGVYGRAETKGASDADAALLHGWWASAVWITGDRDRCRALIEQAGTEAARSGDHRALANVETVRAMLAALDGDRRANEAHYLRALDHAERAGDVLQMVRIHVNRGSRHLEEGAYPEAIEELEVALRLTDLSGFAVFRALGLVNRGHAHLRMGQLDRAAADYGEGRTLYERLGSRMAAYAWSGLGDVHRLRGEPALARAAYEEARNLTGSTGDLQGLVPALAGLALVLAVDDPDAALVHARAAVEAGPVLGHVGALNALAAVLIARGRCEEGAATATRAGAMARERRDRAGLAEALEIEARARPDRTTALLSEALQVWRSVGDPIGTTRTELALARLAPEPDLEVLESIAARLRRAGARGLAAEAQEMVEASSSRSRPEVRIRTLGGFEVAVAGHAVPPGAWQSKKARDILKILVARRGRPIHREVLIDLLWPDDDPAKTANRLSVALSVIRNVLDPGHRLDQDHYLVADRTTVALAPGRLEVDVERFLADVAAGREAFRSGREEEGARLLERAEAAYLGDLLEEDPYEDWAVALREEARNAYLTAAHTLAEQAERAHDPEHAATLFLRILERDPYDEPAHLGVVRLMADLGRHGEAHRLYRRYCGRMAEIDVEAAPFPRR